ncbi:MAG: type II toxin-antitoxin system Phd/YefM family antitoxin [Candidatus Gracilibacteria bacterium]|nr:type II toxin-antitoxin system Phd/YefM family antitoxin [Candidatus Gracilibacteria bacterium]
MKTTTSTNLKQSLGEMLKNINKEPVKITKRSRDHAVLIGYSEYSHLKELEEYEDILFGLAAKEVMKGGMASKEETQSLLDSIK